MSFGFGFGLPRAPLRGRPLVAAIRSLFAANEPGVWYDPSDLSTLFQDAAGTTPVTAVEQPVGLMLDKSKGLVLGPELVTNGDFSASDLTGWSSSSTFASTAQVDSGQLKVTATGGFGRQVYPFTTVVGRVYKVSGTATKGTGSNARLQVGNKSNGYDSDIVTGINGSALAAVTSINTTTVTLTNIFVATQTTYWVVAGEANSTPGGVHYFDNISVRELPGNHAYQTTTTSRPILSARYNLLTQTENLGHADWSSTQQGIKCTVEQVQAPDGSMTAQKLTALVYPVVPVRGIMVQGTTFRFVVWLKPGILSDPRALVRNNTTAVNLIQANYSDSGITNQYGSCVVTTGSDGWKKFSFTITSGFSPGDVASLYYGWTGAVQIGDSWSVWHPDFRYLNDALSSPEYQRVGGSTDYDTNGFPHYLRFDGVDDWLVTNTITPGIDKVQVFAGVRKLSDAAVSILAELSVSSTLNNGVFALFAPNAAGTYALRSKGITEGWAVSPAGYASPIINVITGLGDISGDRATLRVNGSQVAQSTNDQGSGNFLDYPMYIGRRGGTAFQFNGHLYSLIVRFGSNLPAATIEKTEKYINTKTRAY